MLMITASRGALLSAAAAAAASTLGSSMSMGIHTPTAPAIGMVFVRGYRGLFLNKKRKTKTYIFPGIKAKTMEEAIAAVKDFNACTGRSDALPAAFSTSSASLSVDMTVTLQPYGTYNPMRYTPPGHVSDTVNAINNADASKMGLDRRFNENEIEWQWRVYNRKMHHLRRHLRIQHMEMLERTRKIEQISLAERKHFLKEKNEERMEKGRASRIFNEEHQRRIMEAAKELKAQRHQRYLDRVEMEKEHQRSVIANLIEESKDWPTEKNMEEKVLLALDTKVDHNVISDEINDAVYGFVPERRPLTNGKTRVW